MQKSESLYQQLQQPSHDLVADIAAIEGDILVLGAGGKMGPALAKLAKKAIDSSGSDKQVIGVSRFSGNGLEEELNEAGIKTIKCDLLADEHLQALPNVPNVLYLAGTKFGTIGNEPNTWAMNAYLPGRVADKFKDSRIVVFSTGNVYPLTPIAFGGATEETLPDPVGEYAQSCLGRERVFQFVSAKNGTPILIYRLNYANDYTYGVLLEIAKLVKENKAIDLSMGAVNVIWQDDANEIALRALRHCSVPAKILNVTGPETISVRWLAEEFGRMFEQPPVFTNREQPTALLNNAAKSFELFGYPRTPLKRMMALLVEHINRGGKTIDKKTHFQEREGRF